MANAVSGRPDGTAAFPPTRARTEYAQRIRARLLRGGLYCLLVILAFCAAVTWQRQEQNARELKRTVQQRVVVPLQRAIDRYGTLPLAHPGADADGQLRGPCQYLDAESIRVLRATEEPVIVGSTSQVGLLLRRNGFFVVAYEAGRVRVEWLTVEAFTERVLAQAKRVKERLKAKKRSAPVLP